MLTVLAEKLMFIHVGDGNRPSVATSGKAPEFGASRLEQLDRGGGVVLLISTYNA